MSSIEHVTVMKLPLVAPKASDCVRVERGDKSCRVELSDLSIRVEGATGSFTFGDTIVSVVNGVITEISHAEQVSETETDHGSGGARSGIRQKARHSGEGSEGL